MILRRATFAIAAAGFLAFAGLGHGQEAEVTPWSTVPGIFDCNPKVLKKRRALTLTMAPRHGRELAILRVADKKFYFLVVGSPPPEMHPLMTPTAFSEAKQVELPADIKGLDWSYNGKESRIFTKPGRYVVHSSDALESEQGGFRCTVNYRG